MMFRANGGSLFGDRLNGFLSIPQFWIFFVKIPGDPAGALPDSQDLGGDLVALPLPAPCLPRGGGCNLQKIKRISVNPRMQ